MAVITPAVGETPLGVNTTAFGVLKFAWFRILKNSARNCIRIRSRIGVSFSSEKSHVVRPGPVSVSRPRFPSNPLLFGGARNAAGLKYSFGLPIITGPVKFGFANGRTGFFVSPVFDGL